MLASTHQGLCIVGRKVQPCLRPRSVIEDNLVEVLEDTKHCQNKFVLLETIRGRESGLDNDREADKILPKDS